MLSLCPFCHCLPHALSIVHCTCSNTLVKLSIANGLRMILHRVFSGFDLKRGVRREVWVARPVWIFHRIVTERPQSESKVKLGFAVLQTTRKPPANLGRYPTPSESPWTNERPWIGSDTQRASCARIFGPRRHRYLIAHVRMSTGPVQCTCELD